MEAQNSVKIDNDLKSLKGKESVDKGRVFEDQVAIIYKLLGASIIQNIEIVNKKVDILATFPVPGSKIGHRVLIECKNESKAANQNARVNEFLSIIDNARKLKLADSATIITQVPWSDQAKGTAYLAGIEIVTIQEKISQMLDLSSYLQSIIESFEIEDPRRPSDPALGKYYVDLSAKKYQEGKQISISSISAEVQSWSESPKVKNHLAILGEYGTGKSSLCNKIACDFAKKWIDAPLKSRIPILINLKEFTKTIKIESIISSFLDIECGVANPKYRLFHEMNKAGVFLIILDGFDEMAVKVDSTTLELNLSEIEKLSAPENSKLILTSRTEYFMSKEEELHSFNPAAQLFSTRKGKFEIMIIDAWEDEKINLFLRNRVKLMPSAKENWEVYRDQIKIIPGLSDLSKRPVLLEMIVKTLPTLIATNTPINRPSLYETYLKEEIKRQVISKRRSFLIEEPIRLDLIHRMALKFWTGGNDSITFHGAQQFVRIQIKNLSAIEIEHYTRDLLSGSFLIRDGDKFRFSHRSILEYLIAKALVEEISLNKPVSIGRKSISNEIVDFICEMGPNTSTLKEWIDLTKNECKPIHEVRAGSAIEIILRSNNSNLDFLDIAGAKFKQADFNHCDFSKVKIKDTLLRECNFIAVRFSHEQFLSARIESSFFSIIIICKPLGNSIKRIRKVQRDYSSKIDFLVSTTLITGVITGYYPVVKGVISLRYVCSFSKDDFIWIKNEILKLDFIERVLFFKEDFEDFYSKSEPEFYEIFEDSSVMIFDTPFY